ncbi:MAG: glycine oxidase ThiO [Umezawaea sp.]
MVQRVTVLGGGVIGLSVAWRVAASGCAVTVFDDGARTAGSWVAGGMLAPVTESWPGEEELLDLGSRSLAMWSSFAGELGDVGLRTGGTLAVALDSADLAVLDQLAGHLRGLGREADRLTGRELRALEPGLGPRVRGGLSVPGDLAVDNRRLLSALRGACAAHDVRFEPRRATPSTVDADVVVVAAGAWSGGLHPALAPLIRPVKGEILRLAGRRGALPPPTRTVRAHVEGRPVYLVPKDDGLVVGATQYENGFDEAVTVGGVRDLLRDAEVVLPGIAEYELVESAVGFRAGSPDNMPVIGWLEPGVLAATGHHRNGLLLAPITAEKVLALLREGGSP